MREVGEFTMHNAKFTIDGEGSGLTQRRRERREILSQE